jgi:hypothetical protein
MRGVVSPECVHLYQLSTPAFHIFIIDVFNFGQDLITGLLQGLTRRGWSVGRKKNFPQLIISYRGLT